MLTVLGSMCHVTVGCGERRFGGKPCFCAAYVCSSETSATQPRPTRNGNLKTRQTL